MKILLILVTKLYLVMAQSYTLVKSDLVTTGAHTWVDETSTSLSTTATLCSSLKQPYVTISSDLAKSISNQYIVNDNDHEIYIKVIVAGTWEGDSLVIKSNTATLLTQQLTTATQLNEVYCTLTNVKVMVFKIQALKNSLITSGSDKILKLDISIPTLNNAAKIKTIYVGPVLIYEIGSAVAPTNTYVSNQQFYYFTSSTQNPNTVLPNFNYNTINSIPSQQYDLLTFGNSAANFIIGGYRRWNTGTITFTQTLQIHYKIKFSFYVYAFDTSTILTSANLIITINGASGSIIVPDTSITRIQAGNLYGNSGMDSVYFVDYEVDHVNTNLQITIQQTTTIDLGITNFYLLSKNCPQFCQACRTEGTCDACSSVDNRNQVTCQCNEQYYENLLDNTCKPCDYRCAKCVYDVTDVKGNCLLCKYGFDINTKCSTCIYSYQFENKVAVKCENCQPCCLTCTGPTDKDCITFKKPYMIMPDNQAVLECPSNYYIVQQTADRTLCVMCDVSCKTCAETQSKCTTCYSGYDLLFNQCLLSCPTKTYRLNKDCTPCADSQCEICSESQCLFCLPNKYMSRISKLCISPCDSGFYGDDTTRSCKKCHQTCKECNNPLFTQCSTCPDNTFMLVLDSTLVTGICYKICKEGYYPSGKFCVPCYEGCQFCTSPTVCQTCVAGFYLYNDFCVETCPSKMYANQFVQKCLKCNDACIECTGGENYQCLTCSGGLLQYQGKCYPICPIGTVGVNGLCQSCALNCDICVGTNVNDCTQCSTQKYILNGQCYDVCPPSYQGDIQTFTCEYCIENCETCVSSSCKLCQSGYFFQDGQCLSSCYDGYYQSINDRKCQPCNLICKTCSGPDLDDCLTCPSSYYFYFNNCLPECPDGYYGATGKICTECHTSCLTCNGPLINNCDSCPLTTYIYQAKCLSVCPNGTYASDTYQSCMPCHVSCLTCQGGSSFDCLTCPVYIERMQCVTSCSSGYILSGVECNPLVQITINCDPQCATCALQSSNCVTCQPSRQQNKPQCTCQRGFYDVGTTNCSPCDHKCATCKVQADNCQTCKGNRYGSTCICPDYYYEDGISLNCPKCDYKCELCQNNICTTCADRRENIPTCTCPDGFFDNLTPICQPCSGVCTTCVDIADKCLLCSGIRENPPFCTCPSGYFDFQGQCIKCAFECGDCDSNGCVSCKGNMSGPFVGKCICKEGYSRKSIGSVYCTNCNMGVPYSILTSGLNKIKIDFGGPLDLVDTTKTGCDQYFQASTLSTLGTSSICTIDENTIVVTLGKYATIDIGHTFSFGTGFKLKICQTGFPTFQTSSLIMDPAVSNEENLPYITFVAQQPKTICEAVVIKYTLGNTGSRNLDIFSWDLVQPQNYVNAQLSTIVSSITPAKTYDTNVTIPRLVLKPFTTFSFNIQLRNFLQLDASNTFFLQTLGPAQISIQEPEEQNTFQRYDTTLLNFTFVYSNCTLTSEMSEKVEVLVKLDKIILAEQNQIFFLQMSSAFDFQIPINPYILQIGSNNISVAINVPSQSLQANIFMNQEIAEGTLIVKVSGGNRQVGDVAIVILTASVIDQDIDPKETDPFQYIFSWTCFDVLKGAECLDLYGKLIKYPNGKSVVIQASELSQYNSYVFSAETKKGNKQATGKSMIQIVEVDVPQLQSANEKEETEIITQTFNYYDEIQLSYQYSLANPDNLFYSATIIYDQVSVKSFKFYSLSFKFRLLDYFTNLNSIQGNKITLRTSVYNPTYVMPSLRSIILSYNLPPSNCTLIQNNPDDIIYDLKTYVNMTIAYCEDEDQPLEYKVLFYNDKDMYDYDFSIGKFINNINILDYQSNNTIAFQLPFVGPQQTTKFTSFLVFMIKDNKNGISNLTTSIVITKNYEINQTQLNKMIDHSENLQDTLQIQDLIVSRVVQMDNCSQFKYDIIRKNDLIAQNDLSIDQQNVILNQMIQLINDKEVISQFKVQLDSLNSFNKIIQSNFEKLKTLQLDTQSTLQQQSYINNYYKYFDLFSTLITNSKYFNSTNEQVLEYIEQLKTQLIELTILNSDGFTIENDLATLQIRKASYKIINEITGNILKEETVFRLLESTQSNYQYYFNKFIVNPYLNEETFPQNDSIEAEAIYLRVVDELTQQNAIMLQPYSYTFIVDEDYANNKTICIQKLFDIWTSKDIETILINKTAISCKIFQFNPFTIVINSTVVDNTTNNNTNQTTDNTDEQDEQDEQDNTDEQNSQNNNTNNSNNNTNNNNTNNNNTNNNNPNNNNNSNQTTNLNNTSNTLLISEPFFIYLICIGSLTLLFAFFAHYKDTQFAKVYNHKKSQSEIVITNQKDETPDMKKSEIFTYKVSRNQYDQSSSSLTNITKPSSFKKFKLILLNFHTLGSIFYRYEAYRKITYFNYVIRFLFIQLSIFISYIYFSFDYQLSLVFLLSPLAFSIYTFLMNIPSKNKIYVGLKLFVTILSLSTIGLAIYRVVDYITDGNEYNLTTITFFLAASILYDNLIYNMIVIMILFMMTIKEGAISLWIIKFMQSTDQEQIIFNYPNSDAIKEK